MAENVTHGCYQGLRVCVATVETAEMKQLRNRFQEDLGHCVSQS